MKLECDISIIIVNYNGKRYLDNLLTSLCCVEKGSLSYEVIVVDNSSSDDSVEYMKQNFCDRMPLKVIEAGENLGFAGGNNRGVQEARGRYLIFLNNDTAVEKNWMVELFRFINEHPKCGMVNSKLLFFYDFIKMTFCTDDKMILEDCICINGMRYLVDNKFCKDLLHNQGELICFGHSEIAIPLLAGVGNYEVEIKCKQAYGSYNEIWLCGQRQLVSMGQVKTFFLRQESVSENVYSLIQNAGSGINDRYDGYDIGFCNVDDEKYSRPYELSNGCGASIMMSKEDFIECGGFDDRFFMYYEDTDLSFRLKKLGKDIMYCPTSIVRHVHTGSSKEWSPFFCYQVARNKLLFVYKNISKYQFWKYFIKQMASAIKYRNKAQILGNIDAVKMAVFHGNCSFPTRL